MKLTTPILLLVFNRPMQTKKVFEEIRRAKPSRLYIAANYPRTNELGEMERCNEVKKIVSNVDWKCETHYLERKSYLECGESISSAINWFFKNIKEGIILEDDCLPNQDFFIFCQKLLEKYRYSNEIMNIGGYNPLEKFDTKDSYIFSKHPDPWGWATWRSAWEKFDYNIYEKITDADLKRYWPNIIDRFFRRIVRKRMLSCKIEAWDSQWVACLRLNEGLSVVPRNNLIENIGFSEMATNTKPNFWDEKFIKRKNYNMSFPIIHPERICVNKKFENRRRMQDLLRKVLKKLNSF